MIDRTGKLVINREFDSPTIFTEGLAPVKIDKKVGYMDMQGNIVIKPQFDAGSIFVNGIAPVQLGKKCGYIDKNGKMVIEGNFEWDQRIIDQFTSYYTLIKGL